MQRLIHIFIHIIHTCVESSLHSRLKNKIGLYTQRFLIINRKRRESCMMWKSYSRNSQSFYVGKHWFFQGKAGSCTQVKQFLSTNHPQTVDNLMSIFGEKSVIHMWITWWIMWIKTRFFDELITYGRIGGGFLI